MISSYRYSGIKRRDTRNKRDEVRPPSGSKKNTKRWCRGVVGREHDAEWQSYVERKHCQGLFFEALKHWSVLVCKSCGKEIKTDYGKIPWWRRSSVGGKRD